MKKELFLMSFFLLAMGCGAAYVDDVKGSNILWAGNISDSSRAQEVFNKTVACIQESFGIRPSTSAPKLVFLDGSFFINGLGPYDGYTSFLSNTLYVRAGREDRELRIVSHESIHWTLQVGDEIHGTPYFKICEGAL